MKITVAIFNLSLAACGFVAAMPARAQVTAPYQGTHGTACRGVSASDNADIEYTYQGVSNRGTVPRRIACPVVRSTNGKTTQRFYVDGSNNVGSSTQCTLYSLGYRGEILGSSAFTSSAPTYDVPLDLPAQRWTYATVICLLQPSGGTFFGVLSEEKL